MISIVIVLPFRNAADDFDPFEPFSGPCQLPGDYGMEKEGYGIKKEIKREE